eukprot:8869983-Lingulodinium_polyedra.AAC.1
MCKVDTFAAQWNASHWTWRRLSSADWARTAWFPPIQLIVSAVPPFPDFKGTSVQAHYLDLIGSSCAHLIRT